MSLSSEPYGSGVGIEDGRREDIARLKSGDTGSPNRGERTGQRQNHRDNRRNFNHNEYICRVITSKKQPTE